MTKLYMNLINFFIRVGSNIEKSINENTIEKLDWNTIKDYCSDSIF